MCYNSSVEDDYDYEQTAITHESSSANDIICERWRFALIGGKWAINFI